MAGGLRGGSGRVGFSPPISLPRRRNPHCAISVGPSLCDAPSGRRRRFPLPCGRRRDASRWAKAHPTSGLEMAGGLRGGSGRVGFSPPISLPRRRNPPCAISVRPSLCDVPNGRRRRFASLHGRRRDASWWAKAHPTGGLEMAAAAQVGWASAHQVRCPGDETHLARLALGLAFAMYRAACGRGFLHCTVVAATPRGGLKPTLPVDWRWPWRLR